MGVWPVCKPGNNDEREGADKLGQRFLLPGTAGRGGLDDVVFQRKWKFEMSCMFENIPCQCARMRSGLDPDPAVYPVGPL